MAHIGVAFGLPSPWCHGGKAPKGDLDLTGEAPFYGTHRGKKNLRWKGDPDFRPPPLAGK